MSYWSKWKYIDRNGQQYGPMTTEQMIKVYNARIINKNTLIQQGNESQWIKLKQSELYEYISNSGHEFDHINKQSISKSQKVILVVLICIVFLIAYRDGWIKSNEFIGSHKSYDAPAKYTTKLPGHSYRVTQMFFNGEQSEKTLNAIESFLSTECEKYNIRYENLRYTDDGYYVCDFYNCPIGTEEQAKELGGNIQSDFYDYCASKNDNFNIENYVIQYEYLVNQ